jgi:hypothetical protein
MGAGAGAAATCCDGAGALRRSAKADVRGGVAAAGAVGAGAVGAGAAAGTSASRVTGSVGAACGRGGPPVLLASVGAAFSFKGRTVTGAWRPPWSAYSTLARSATRPSMALFFGGSLAAFGASVGVGVAAGGGDDLNLPATSLLPMNKPPPPVGAEVAVDAAGSSVAAASSVGGAAACSSSLLLNKPPTESLVLFQPFSTVEQADNGPSASSSANTAAGNLRLLGIGTILLMVACLSLSINI